MNVGRCPHASRLRSAAGSINSGRHILESRCAERCANDAFLTSFRATLNTLLDVLARAQRNCLRRNVAPICTHRHTAALFVHRHASADRDSNESIRSSVFSEAPSSQLSSRPPKFMQRQRGLTVCELEVWLALVYAFGAHRLPQAVDHWKSNCCCSKVSILIFSFHYVFVVQKQQCVSSAKEKRSRRVLGIVCMLCANLSYPRRPW